MDIIEYVIDITPDNKYSQETNDLLLFVSEQIANLDAQHKQISQQMDKLVAEKKQIGVQTLYEKEVKTMLAQLKRSAQVLHDIARRKINKY